MFRNALFRVGVVEFTLPCREWEIGRVQRDYGCTFVKWIQ